MVWRIMQSMRTLKSYVRVVCYSKQHRNGVELWYTGYSIYSTDEAAYDDSMVGCANTWWPLEYDDKASALRKFDQMWKCTGSYKVVLFNVAQEEPAPNGSWRSDFKSWALYEPPSPLQVQPSTVSFAPAAAAMPHQLHAPVALQGSLRVQAAR